MIQLHTDDLIPVRQIHADHAHRSPSGRSYICFLETDTHSMLCDKENICIPGSCLHFNQLIIIPQIDSRQPIFSDIAKFHDWGFFHNTSLCNHEEVFIFLIVLNRYHGRNLFTRIQLQNIDDRNTSRCAPSLRYFISF